VMIANMHSDIIDWSRAKLTTTLSPLLFSPISGARSLPGKTSLFLLTGLPPKSLGRRAAGASGNRKVAVFGINSIVILHLSVVAVVWRWLASKNHRLRKSIIVHVL